MFDWIQFFLIGPGALFSAYAALQCFTAYRLKGVWRLVALVPVPFVAYVAVSTVEAYRAESNLWPIGLMAVSSAAATYLAALLVGGYLLARRRAGAGPKPD